MALSRDNDMIKFLQMGQHLLIFVLLLWKAEESYGFENFERHPIVPFTDDFVWESQLDGEFGWRPNAELATDRNKRTELTHEQVNAVTDNGSKKQGIQRNLATPSKQEASTEVTSNVYTKTDAVSDEPQFHDQCKRIFCRVGRTCKVSTEGKPECVCADAGYCRNHQKEVCGSDGQLYPSHCELHRVACIQKKHIGIDHTGKRCSASYSSKKHSSKKFLVTTPSYPASSRTQADTACLERAYNRFKNNLVHYHCARLGETDCFFNHSKKKFVVSNMFGYYDANGNNLLEREELTAIEHLDHLDRLSQTCHLADILSFDDLDYEVNGTISKTEFYIAFKVVEPILEDSLKVFTTFVSTGNSVELKCGIRGANKVVWKRRGRVIDDSVSDDVKILDDGSLYINQLELYHMGNYSCQGSSDEHIVQTHVLFVQMVPIVHVHPLAQFHLPGVTAAVRCHADGVPQPEISWEKNEAPLSTNSYNQSHHLFLHNNTTLEIKSLSYKIDTGAYKCTAKNAAGSSHGIGTIVVENTDVPVHFSSELKQTELFAVFHDHGYTIYELNHCHIQHQVAGSFQPSVKLQKLDAEELLCSVNKSCSWGDAVNVKDQFIYVTQPDLHRILVIEITNRMNPTEVIVTEVGLFPVKLRYLENLDQIWVTSWTAKDNDQNAKIFQVITGASQNISHHLMPLTGTSKIQNLFLPTDNNLKSNFHYGYIHYDQQMSLQRVDLLSMTPRHILDLAEYQCMPDGVVFLPLGGYVLVDCTSLRGQSSFHLVIDYITDVVLRKSEVGGSFYMSPDARHLMIVGNQILTAYTVTADGQIEHIFDRSFHHDTSHLAFLPSESGIGYDVFAITKNNDNIIHIDLNSRKTELIEGIGDMKLTPSDFLWGQHSSIVVGSGNFAEHLLVSSKKSIIAIDGHRRRLHCEWQNVNGGSVIVSFISSRF